MKIAKVHWLDENGLLVAGNDFTPVEIRTGDTLTLEAKFEIPGDKPRIVGPYLMCPECGKGALDRRQTDYLCPECRAVISDE